MNFQFSSASAAAAAARGGGRAAPPSGGHFAVPPFHGNQQPPQRPLYPPIPDSGSAGLTADAARDLKKARIRKEILAREAEEQEVLLELQLERAMAERLRGVQFRPMAGAPDNRFAEPRVGDSVQRLGVPPPRPNAGPYLVRYTPQVWGREQQGSVQAPPRNLERPELVEVPHCSGERHPIHIGYKLEASVGKRSGSVSVQAANNLGTCSLPIPHGVGGERLGSVHHSDNQGPLLPISHHLESMAGEYPGSGKRSALLNGYCPEANIGENPPASYPELFTRLETGLLGHHHPEVGVSGWPPLAAHPIGVVGQPIWPPSNSDITASKSANVCSGKGKEKAEVKQSAKKAPIEGNFRDIMYNIVKEGYAHAPPASNYVCYGCGNCGHNKTSCPFSKKEAKTQKVENNKWKIKSLAEGGICFQCGGSGHGQKDCLLLHEKDAPPHPFKRKPFKGKDRCYYCGGREHRVNDCLLLIEKVERNKNSLQKQNSNKNIDLEDNKKKNKRKRFY